MPATAVALLALLVIATGFGAVWRARAGRIREQQDGETLSASDLGAALGERATLVQFSSTFCAPCRTARVVLADVSGRVDGVAHVEIDAESHLDLVRRLGIMRTPTVLVLDSRGRVVQRATGVPRRADVLAALADVP